MRDDAFKYMGDGRPKDAPSSAIEYIKNKMDERGFSQADLSRIIGCSASKISAFMKKVKSGTPKGINVIFLQTIIYVLDANMKEFIYLFEADFKPEYCAEIQRIQDFINERKAAIAAKSEKYKTAFHYKKLPKTFNKITIDRLN